MYSTVKDPAVVAARHWLVAQEQLFECLTSDSLQDWFDE